jgi:hypothetical protein
MTALGSRRLLAAGLLLSPAFAGATVATWPGPAPCSGTLQACLDALPAGAEIRIDSDAPAGLAAPGVDLVRMPVAQRLVAAPGRRPVLPPGFSIEIVLRETTLPLSAGSALGPGHGAGGDGAAVYHVSGLTLSEGGQIRVGTSGLVGAELEIQRMRFERSSSAPPAIQIFNDRPLTLQLRIHDNVFESSAAGRFLQVESSTGTLRASVEFNRLRVDAPAESALRLEHGGSGGGALIVASNQIRGSFSDGAVVVRHPAGAGSSLLAALITSNLLQPAQPGQGAGIRILRSAAPMALQISNNTVLDQALALRLQQLEGTAPPGEPTRAVYRGNLLGWNGTAAQLPETGIDLRQGLNLYFGNAQEAIGFEPGAFALRADPRLVSRTRAPWLRPDSPAIDADDDLPFYDERARPWLDAHGERRIKGSAVDLGAFEFGDSWIGVRARPDNTTGNFLLFDHPATSGQPEALLFASPDGSLGLPVNLRPLGVWWASGSGQMGVFNQDLSAMPIGSGYSLFVPAPFRPSAVVLPGPSLVTRVARVGSEPVTRLNLGSPLSDRPELIVLATQNWNPQQPPASIGVYNPRSISLRYEASSWSIVNLDGSPIPAGAAFNVFSQPPSPAAFQLSVGGRSSWVAIDHPLLNGRPCARIAVMPVFDNAPHGLTYVGIEGAGAWLIQRNAVTPWPNNAFFNVVFSPRQVEECSGPLLFSDGFE